MKAVVERIVPVGGAVTVAVDDTLFHRYGRKVHGARYQHDGSAKGRHGDPGRPGRGGRGVRAALMREWVQGPRYSDWAMTATGIDGQYLLIRRLISGPDQYTFYLCWAPPGRPATMTYFITIAGRRWPVEETFKTGKDVLGWDQCQARTFDAICRHTALAALAQLRAATG